MPSTPPTTLPYDGFADIDLTHGQAPGIGRKARTEAVKVSAYVASSSSHKVIIEVGRALGIDLLLPPDVTFAEVTLPCGRSLAGTVSDISPIGDSFEIDTTHQQTSRRPD